MITFSAKLTPPSTAAAPPKPLPGPDCTWGQD
jgi:hypothetical protein